MVSVLSRNWKKMLLCCGGPYLYLEVDSTEHYGRQENVRISCVDKVP